MATLILFYSLKFRRYQKSKRDKQATQDAFPQKPPRRVGINVVETAKTSDNKCEE
jgi:hypothetical protein